jgi:hypothetical protein
VIADIALAAPSLALPALLSLVADPHHEIRRVVAKGLGRWQYQGHGERLLSLVGTWPEQERIAALVHALRGGDQAVSARAEAVELLRITALLCYTEAARSLPAGGLSTAMVDGFRRLVDRTLEPQALQVVREEVLPVLLQSHVTQIGALLDTLTQFPALRADLCQNMASVYQTGGERSRAINHVLQGWLGAIDYQYGGPIAREGAWRYLSLILKQLEAAPARAAALAACMRLAGQDPAQLRWALREIRPAERAGVVADLTEICRQQRAGRINLRQAALWADGVAKSSIEEVLIGWLFSTSRQARTDSQETERLRLLSWETLIAITRRLDVSTAAQPIDDALHQQYRPTGFYRARLIPALLAISLSPTLLKVIALLRTRIHALAAEEPVVLETLLDRWLKETDLRDVALGIELLLNLDVDQRLGIGVVGMRPWLKGLWHALGR